MGRITWDELEDRTYETGVDHAVLYTPNAGDYDDGVPWNGMTNVTETPSGAEATPIYADNIKWLDLRSKEEFGGTIEALTYPDEFYPFDGGVIIKGGIVVGQQNRAKFGFSYRTLLGNAEVGDDLGYKLHLVYGAQAGPSEKTRSTVNDTPEPTSFSWEFTTTPVPMTGHKPVAHLEIISTKVVKAELEALENVLYGSTGVDPSLPLPDDVVALFPTSGSVVTP